MGATSDVINAAIALVAYSVDDSDGRIECLTPERNRVLALYDALKRYDAKVARIARDTMPDRTPDPSLSPQLRPVETEPGAIDFMNDHYRKLMNPDTKLEKPVRAYDDTFSAVPVVQQMLGEKLADCRNRMRNEGKPHPKSGCYVCKTGGLTGCRMRGMRDGRPVQRNAAELPGQAPGRV